MSDKSLRHHRWFVRCAAGLSVALGGAGVTGVWATQSEPGLYRLKGWNGGGVYQRRADDLDINGEIGHPLSVSPPTANCRPGGSFTGTETRIVSGELPPGLAFGYGGHFRRIGGIPRDRGHWIVELAVDRFECNGVGYVGFQQVLRFHITGTGRVIQ